MANLGDDFRDAAEKLKKAALELVAHAFNSASEKDMTAIAALKSQEMDSTEEFSGGDSLPMSRFSDELFSAVKKGDAIKVRALLDIEEDDNPGMTKLMEAIREEKEEEYIHELLEVAGVPADNYDLSMAALVLAAAGGSPEKAREMLEEMKEDDIGSEFSERAIEKAMSRGNMAAAAMLKQRMRAIEFNHHAATEDCKQSLYGRVVAFFMGGNAKAEAAAASKFVGPKPETVEPDYDFVDKMSEGEKVGLAKSVLMGLKSMLSFGSKT